MGMRIVVKGIGIDEGNEIVVAQDDNPSVLGEFEEMAEKIFKFLKQDASFTIHNKGPFRERKVIKIEYLKLD